MFASYLGISVITTRLILKNEDVVNLGKTFAQSGIIAVGIIIVSVLFSMLRAYRVCETTPGEKKSLGIASGFASSIWAVIFALVVFILASMTGLLTGILTAILPFLADYVELIKGFYVALAGILGYWFGRIFTRLC